jgi:two-component system, NarL family, nitrate/nitrite response regulator NarL
LSAIRVYVADDHPIYRDGLMRALARRPEFDLVGGSADGLTALAELEELRPDVAILDLRMPGIDGIGLMRAIKDAELGTRVVLVSAFSDSDLIYQAVATGASAYLHKDADRDQICDAVAAVARGETRLPQVIQERLLSAIRARAAVEQSMLTAREREILMLSAEGLTAPAIGARLHVSPSTVKSHLQHVYEKLGVSQRTAAVAEAMRRGLLH